METSFDTVIEKFLFRVEKDRNFFNYYKTSNSESLDLVKNRALNYLTEAISRFKLKSNISYNILEFNDTKTGFISELTDEEIYIIVNLMYEIHLQRDVMLLKVMTERYAPSDLTVFSPANERNSFLNMVDSVKAENISLLDTYDVRNRLSGTHNLLNYTL